MLRSDYNVTPELLKQALIMRKHKHLQSGSNGERMCRCVTVKTKGGVSERRWDIQGGHVFHNCRVTLWALCVCVPSPDLLRCVTGFTFSASDYREREDMYDEIIRLKKVRVTKLMSVELVHELMS